MICLSCFPYTPGGHEQGRGGEVERDPRQTGGQAAGPGDQGQVGGQAAGPGDQGQVGGQIAGPGDQGQVGGEPAATKRTWLSNTAGNFTTFLCPEERTIV